jgi:hypothetical protein
MKLIPVSSSMILAVGYDASAKELEVVFSSGAVWRYREVPRKVYRELLAADSKGSYMRSCVIGMCPEYRLRRR